MDDPTVIVPAAGASEPTAAVPRARTEAHDLVFVGDIPAFRLGFQPRPGLLTRLNQASPGQPVMLTGTCGVGKTQLAATYARARLADRWRLVAWVNARNSETLLAGMAEVADATGLSPGGSRPHGADAGQTVRDWLEADGERRLLVFDDVADPLLLRPFVPTTGESRILITVAGEPATEFGTRVPVEAFSAEEALALLDGRTGLTDEDGALAVAVQLGYLPLALDQAAATIAQQHLDYPAYLAKLRAQSAEDLLARREGEEEQPPPPGLAEAVLLAVAAASAADRLGVSTKVMELVAMLSPALVRRDLLRAAGEAGTLLGGGRRVAASMVDQALERLNERSLLGFSLDGQAVSVHSLAARVIRASLARQGRFVTAGRAAAAAVEGRDAALADERDNVAVREMISQVTALAENADAAPGGAGEQLAAMLTQLRSVALNHLAHAYRESGRTAEAVPLIEEILAARERLLGVDDPRTLASRNNLARAYRATGRPADAIPLFEKNVAVCERLLGADDPKTVASRHNLDLARQEQAQNQGGDWLQVPAPGLLPLDRLEQRLEVPLAEPLRAVPLDQLEEHGRPVLDRLGEDLQQVPVLVPVG